MSPWWAVATFVVTTFVAGGAARLVDPSASADVPSLLWLAPALGAGLTWLIGRRWLAAMLPVAVSRRQVVAHTILGVGSAVVLVGLVALGTALVPGAGGDVDGSPWLLALLALPAALALELGWRGTLQPLVEPRLGRMWASVAVGIAWAAWRLEVDAEAGFVGTIVASVALSVLLGHLGTGSWWQRWLTASVVQALVTAALPFLVGSAPSAAGSFVVAGASVVTAGVWLLMFRAAQRRRAARAAATA